MASYHGDPNVWSPSRVAKYERCPRDWWLDTYGGGERGLAPEHWRRGSVAHAGLEAGYVWASAHRGPRPTTMERFFPVASDALDKAWADYQMPDDPAKRDELREQVRRVLARLPVPHPDNILGPEMEIRATLSGFEMAGSLDLPLRTGPRSLHVRDWKSYQLPSEEDMMKPVQLPFYGLLAALRWPWAETITVGIYSIPANAERVVEVTPEMRQAAADRMVAVADAAMSDTECAPSPSQWCDTCAHKARCPVFNPDAGVGPDTDVSALAQMRDAVVALEGF